MAFNPNFQNDRPSSNYNNNNNNNYRNNGGGGGPGPSRNYNGGGPRGGGGRGGGRGGYNNNYNNNNNNNNYNNNQGNWNRGGGGNKRNREEDFYPESKRRRNENEHSMAASPASMQTSTINVVQRLKDSVWGLGSGEGYTPEINIPELSAYLQSNYELHQSTIHSIFRVALTELPHKIPHYVALIAYLAQTSLDSPLTTYSSSTISQHSLPSKPIPGLPARPSSSAAAVPVDSEIMTTTTTTKDEEEAELNLEGEDTEMEVTTTSEEVETNEIPAPPKRINVGREIVKDLIRALQVFLDTHKWRSVRYIVISLSHLAALPSPLISPSSILSLLNLFSTSILDEPGLRANRGDECVRIIVESLIRLGPSSSSEEEREREGEGIKMVDLRTACQNYQSLRKIDAHLFGEGDAGDQFEDRIEILVSTLSSDASSSTSNEEEQMEGINAIILPSIFELLPTSPRINSSTISLEDYSGPISNEFFETLVIPAETEEIEGKNSGIGGVGDEASSTGLRGDEGVGYEGVRVYLKLFEDESVPTPYDPSGTILKSLIHDLISMYEVNRKECARILLELPKWIIPGTFKSKAIPRDEQDDEDRIDEIVGGKDWILENLIVESILTSLFSLPSPSLPSSYYHSLLCELCRLSPSTIAPALGKCIRRLYAGLGADVELGNPVLEPEGIRRFAEWFSVHLSNFGFAWSFGDWVGDMELDDLHPKKIFVARVIELEIRLSYYDRVKGTIPEALFETGIMEDSPPSSEYTYDSEDNPYNGQASDLLRLMRSKGTIEEVVSELTALETFVQQGEEPLSPHEALALKRDLTIQTILNVGSRSFSHFLNVLERYLPLIRSLINTPAARSELLITLASFWSRNSQFHLIVLNKFLQYRIIDSENIVDWIFSTGKGGKKGWSNIDKWIALKGCLITVMGRVKSARKKVEELKKREEEEGNLEDELPTSSFESSPLRQGKNSLEILEKELIQIILKIIKEFNELLPTSGITTDDWNIWWIEGWFREFCRTLTESKLLGSKEVLRGVEELGLEDKSMVKIILESAKAWNDFT